MPITEGNEQTVTIDQEALGGAIAAGLRAAGIGGQQTSQQQPSRFEQLLDHFKQNQENDEGSLNAIKELITAYGEDLQGKLDRTADEKMVKLLMQERDRSTYAVIRTALDPYIGDDEHLQEYADVIRDRVVKRFNTEKQYEDARVRYSRGDVDVDALKKLAKEEVNKFNAGRNLGDTKTKSPAGARTSETGSAETKNALAGSSGSAVEYSSLSQKEKDLWNARLGTAQRLGLDRKSDKAIELAQKAIVQLRQGQAKAKEKGLAVST